MKIPASLAALLYFATIAYLLKQSLPGSYCAYCGPSPGLWWGHPPSVSPRDYRANRQYYDLIFLLPHLATAMTMTIVACGVAPAIAARLAPRRRLAASVGITFGLAVVFALFSDIGSLLRVWSSPLFFLHTSHSLYTLTLLCKLFGAVTILAGVVEALRPKVVRGGLAQ